MNSKLIYLVQTDTTVGFSSSERIKLSSLKKRPSEQKILQVVNSFKTLKLFTRIPKKHKKIVRNSKKTTFIYPNTLSFRIINKEDNFYDFVAKFKNIYSTSANITTKNFDEKFGRNSVDVIVETKNKFHEANSSSICSLKKKGFLKIR